MRLQTEYELILISSTTEEEGTVYFYNTWLLYKRQQTWIKFKFLKLFYNINYQIQHRGL